VSALHGTAGFIGTLLAGVLCHPVVGGSLKGSSVSTQYLVQLCAGAVVAAWSLLGTFLVMRVTAILCNGLRASDEVEEFGVDLVLAEPDAYPAD
jgi:ammonium transporter, Amt family